MFYLSYVIYLLKMKTNKQKKPGITSMCKAWCEEYEECEESHMWALLKRSSCGVGCVIVFKLCRTSPGPLKQENEQL